MWPKNFCGFRHKSAQTWHLACHGFSCDVSWLLPFKTGGDVLGHELNQSRSMVWRNAPVLIANLGLFIRGQKMGFEISVCGVYKQSNITNYGRVDFTEIKWRGTMTQMLVVEHWKSKLPANDWHIFESSIFFCLFIITQPSQLGLENTPITSVQRVKIPKRVT